MTSTVPATKKRFRIAISYSSDIRQLVQGVAEHLEIAFPGEILFDRFLQEELSGPKLRTRLQGLYLNDSELIVVFASEDYQMRHWCGLEWDAISSSIAHNEPSRYMFFGRAIENLSGLYDPGFIPLEGQSAFDLAKMVRNRYYRLSSKMLEADERFTDPGIGQAVRSNLPRLEFFTGRRAELIQVSDSLEEEERGWGALIVGPGGIGKTSLAIQAATSTLNFEQIVFVAIHRTASTVSAGGEAGHYELPNWTELLDQIARALEAGNSSLISVNERVRLVLGHIKDKRILLLVDNVEVLSDADQDLLYAFLRRLPYGSKAIVTSRVAKTVEARVICITRLDNLSTREIIDEAARRNSLLAKSTDDQRDQLAQQTHGNPLLLQWTIGRLIQGDLRTIQDLLDHIGNSRKTNEALALTLGGLLEKLKSSDKKVLTALAHTLSLLDTRVISEIAGLPTNEARKSLSELSRRSLLLSDERGQKFGLLPIVVDTIRAKFPRLIESSADRLQQVALDIMEKNGGEQYERFSILEENWPVVSAALPYLYLSSNGRVQTACDALKKFCDFTGRWDDRLRLCQYAEKHAATEGNILLAGRRAYERGMVHYRRGDWAHAEHAANEVERYYSDLKAGQGGTALAHRLRSLALRASGRLSQAIDEGKLAVALWRKEEISKDLACALNALAVSQRLAGKYEEARTNYDEALSVARKVNATEYVVDYTGNLADLPIDLKKWDEAMPLVSKALKLSEALGRQELVARNYLRLARVSFGKNDPDSGYAHARQAEQIYAKMQMPQATDARNVAMALDG